MRRGSLRASAQPLSAESRSPPDAAAQHAAAPGDAVEARVDQAAGAAPSAAVSGDLAIAPPSTPARSPSWPWTTAAASLIILAALAAYYNTFSGAFVYDDVGGIIENRSIHQLWPLGGVLSPPRDCVTVRGRPLLNLTLALNYAAGGLDAWGYHAVNLAIHIAAALLLLGILRRTFRLPTLGDRFGAAATPLALAITLLWTLHPLQTESVTYVVQRAESLVGMFYLLTLYCTIRGATSCPPPARPPVAALCPADCPPPTAHRLWYVGAVLACLLGMASKEVMVTAPLMVLLYDRTFLAGSFQAALRRRRGLYLGLATTWGLSAYLVLSSGLVGVAPETGVPDPLSYARSQLGVILHYLRLTVWPSPLCLDYAWPVVCPPWAILPGAMVVALLLAVTLRGLVRRQGYGFLGAWFFLILVPTTSVLPLAQLAFEHRMYLPLAAPAALTVAGAYAFWDRRLMRSAKAGSTAVMLHWAAPVAMLAAVLIALGYAAAVRNADYQSPLAIWQDTVHKRPHNSMAHYNLGVVFDRLDRVDEAIEHYQWALRLQPDYAEAHSNLATALVMSGDTREAIAHYEQAVRIQPDYAMAHNNFGNALASLGKSNEAIEQYHAALSLYPDYAHAHYNLAAFLARLGRTDEAIEHYREALRLQPDYVLAHTNLGIALAATGRTAEAIDHFEYAVQQEPRSASIHCQLALALTAAGKIREATKHYHKTLRLQPNTPVALNNLAWLLATHEPGGPGEAARAVELAQRARDLAGPENASCLDTLAAAYAAAGRFSDAILTAENALQLAQGTGQTPLAKNIVSRLEVYRAGRPYRRPEP